MSAPAEMPEPEAAAPDSGPTAAKPKGKQTLHPDTVKVVHSAHGRTRARLRKEERTPEKMAAIQAELEQHPDVQSVSIDQRTGSVLIEHDKARKGHDVMIEAFADVEMLAGLLFEVPLGTEEEAGAKGGGDSFEYARLDKKLAALVSSVDEWQAQKTGIHGRGAVVSGAVAALGVAQIAIYGISLEMLPGPMLLYIAYDIHKKVRDDERQLEAAKAAQKAAHSAGDPLQAGHPPASKAGPSVEGMQPAAA